MNTPYKNYFAILVMAALFTSCERGIDVNSKFTDAKLAVANDAASNKCRLAYANNWNGLTTETYQYNAQGLVSDCQVDLFGSVFIHATMQYDSKGRLITGTLSYDNITFYDVVFEYENNRIVKETVYEPGSSIIADYTTTAYNQKGQIIKRVSPPFNLYSNFEYDAIGNLLSDEVLAYDNDLFVFRINFKYGNPIKEPKTERPGMPPFSWWWLDEITSPFLPTDRDEFAGDGLGGSFPVFDEDPAQTIISPVAQNLPSDRVSFDNLSGSNFYNYWEYQNCGGKNELTSPSLKHNNEINKALKDRILLSMPLVKGPGLEKQLAERKAILQRLKN